MAFEVCELDGVESGLGGRSMDGLKASAVVEIAGVRRGCTLGFAGVSMGMLLPGVLLMAGCNRSHSTECGDGEWARHHAHRDGEELPDPAWATRRGSSLRRSRRIRCG